MLLISVVRFAVPVVSFHASITSRSCPRRGAPGIRLLIQRVGRSDFQHRRQRREASGKIDVPMIQPDVRDSTVGDHRMSPMVPVICNSRLMLY